MWKFCDLLLHKRRIYSHFNIFVSSFFSSAFNAYFQVGTYVWPQLDNEVSTWFPNPHGIERACEFLLLIYHCSTKQIDFRLQTLLISKKEKKRTCEMLGGVLQKNVSKNFTKFTEKYLCERLILTLLNTFRQSGLQLYQREIPTLMF